MRVDLKNLISRCSPVLMKGIESAAGMCLSRSHYEVTPGHVLLKLIDPPLGDMAAIIKAFDVDIAQLQTLVIDYLEGLRTGNSSSRPKLSRELVEVLETGWMFGSIDQKHSGIRTGDFLAGVLSEFQGEYEELYDFLNENIQIDRLRREFDEITEGSEEAPHVRKTSEGGEPSPLPSEAAEALQRFTVNLTERARIGKLDPVFGREHEIRKMIDILMRRKKNNPILVGEPGVGKTALAEGLALKIAEGDVPDFLKSVRILTLDLGLLQAGAGVKGEFENRLKTVVSAIKNTTDSIICFIDEAHALIGAGGQAGGSSDAANLLKPALARGELRTIAATTWSEYKKYFEKDAALARRFELVKVDEPDEENACVMLRGLKERYEKTHNVKILDSAVVAAVQLSSRYLTGRHLPDKAEGLLDTAAARVKISHSCEPAVLQDLRARMSNLERELKARRSDLDHGVSEDAVRISELEAELEKLAERKHTMEQCWQREMEAVKNVQHVREDISSNRVCESLKSELEESLSVLRSLQNEDYMVSLEVTPDVVASLVSDWTGIPVGKMVRDEAESLLRFEDNLKERIKGQDHAVEAIAKSVRMRKAGVSRSEAPIGVFLFVGPSGVGKTECARGVADLLFGGERNMVSLNMSEYMEKHTVSRLIGSPPGYVGYGEGGVLTEAVRHRPYSVVLLDEVEKAHADVLNIFYQVFDRGTCNDGEGREIDFRNTIIIMTSNLGLDEIHDLCNGPEIPSPETISKQIHPILREYFKPALLARFQVIPFYPLSGDMLTDIASIKLRQLASRLRNSMKIECTYDTEVPEQLAASCHVAETGARALDKILESDILPAISVEILSRMGREEVPKNVHLIVGNDDKVGFEFGL